MRRRKKKKKKKNFFFFFFEEEFFMTDDTVAIPPYLTIPLTARARARVSGGVFARARLGGL